MYTNKKYLVEQGVEIVVGIHDGNVLTQANEFYDAN